MKLKKSILFALLPVTILALGLLIINTPSVFQSIGYSPVIQQFSAWDENDTKYQSANRINKRLSSYSAALFAICTDFIK